MESLQGLPAFALYFVSGYVMILLFSAIYTWITPHCEWTLMRENNTAAAIAFGLTIVGFTIPIASAAINSVGVIDFIIWGIIAMITQLITYFTVRFYMSRLTERLTANEMPAGLFLGCCALATGILNAACMTY
jgi:putative membrane protein